MKYIWIAFALLLANNAVQAQVVINELDSDTPSTDVKEFIELRSDVPFFPLDGFVLVMFNGSTTSSTASKSYYVMDLDGLSTDVNGLALIGNNLVSPVPDKYLPDSTIQNGPDAVAIYSGNASDWPLGTLATTTNLVHALAHAVNSEDAEALRNLLGISVIYSENEGGAPAAQSIQRKADGTYEAKLPTPGAHNDGTGVQFNGITISVPLPEYGEGSTIPVTFSTQNAVATDLNFTFTLNGSGINSADYTGVQSVVIPAGSSSATININIVDDSEDEGDELMKVNIGTIPAGYKRLNDNVEVRIIDNDWTIATWGTPLNPTYTQVLSTAPQDYYQSMEGLSGAALKQAIQDIIANPEVVRGQNYGDVVEILKQADQNPANSNQVWLMYVEQGRAKYKYQDVATSTGLWNREHIFPQSRGGFSNGTSGTPDGINVWLPVSADDITTGHGDAHHIRAEDGPENSSRNNRDYGTAVAPPDNAYNGPSGTQGSWRGDVARALFYMATRYNALSLVNGNPPDNTAFQLGDLATLLQWNTLDPADDFEMNRNNVIYTWQQNRNPFIDHPELAEHIWGNLQSTAWFPNLSLPENEKIHIGFYPNPTTDRITVSGLNSEAQLTIVSLTGSVVFSKKVVNNDEIVFDLAPGVYIARFISGEKAINKKIVIR